MSGRIFDMRVALRASPSAKPPVANDEELADLRDTEVGRRFGVRSASAMFMVTGEDGRPQYVTRIDLGKKG